MDGRQSRGFLKNEMDGAKKGGVTFNLVGKPAGGCRVRWDGNPAHTT
jgi:hypothetical protein